MMTDGLIVGILIGALITVLVIVLYRDLGHWIPRIKTGCYIIIMDATPALLKWLWFRTKFAFTNLKYTDLRLSNSYRQFNRLEGTFERIEDADSLEEAKNYASNELDGGRNHETTIEFGQRHIRELTESLGFENRVYGELKEDLEE